MKVCFFSPAAYGYFNPECDKWAGGAETQQVLLARHMMSKGIEVSFIVGDFGQADVEIHEGITVIKSFAPFKGNRKLRFFPDMSRIRRAMEIADADVYNQRSTSFYTGQLAWFASKLGKAFTFSIGSDYNCYPDCMGRLAWPMPYLYRYGVRKADAIIAQTEKQRILLRDHFGTESVVIRNGIVIDDSTGPAHDEPSSGIPEILWVGSFRRLKRPEMLLELARRIPEADFTMLGGLKLEESYADGVVQEAKKIANLTFAGFIHPNDIDQYYRRAYLYVNTSSLEGFPNTYLHSWRTGLPVFTLEIDPDSLIVDNEIGVTAGTLDSLVEEIRSIVKDPARRNAMSTRALEYVRKNHDIRDKGDQYIDLFERITSPQKSSS